ncbi:hypothetical protein [Dictyobacter arantiisoli]|uniref:Uncharacterized protein n=1 Tax=Dictyobacter arantiisoli TaxID=2014874 RepID=A0A5A5TFN3_9CHLR|nr:hypothetical protein [Dictyobacter arantiisoli]GCF09724.1 hypothetical protein KDI_32880 [Dictyobacter arantiisoli]
MNFCPKKSPRILNTRQHFELRVGLISLAILFSLAFQLNQTYAAGNTPKITYNCINTPDSTSGHCYSMAEWNGASGAFTEIFTNQLYSGGGFVTNEMWIGSGNTRWVEAGLISSDVSLTQGSGSYNHGSTAEFLFWGDVNNSGKFYFHPGPNLASSDFGKTAFVEIQKTSSTAYGVYISNLPSASLFGTSTNNTMSDDYIHTGGELYGATTASAPVNGYSYNEWYNSNGGGSWNLQGDTDGFVNGPWEGYWQSTASSDGIGGDWRTCIRGAGC